MFFINEKRKPMLAADKAEIRVQSQIDRSTEITMHGLYLAYGMIKTPQPEGPKARREAEEKFYAEFRGPGILTRMVSALNVRRSSERDCDQGGQSASRDHAEAKDGKEVVIAGAGNSDGAGAISGHHHERLPTKNLTDQCRVPASSETSCSNSRCAGIEVSMTRVS
ncbi:hypothetical protein [Agrobacterium cavarae]|uniref:hypothetical protein n=1 Tax=Agrobacterium cavarae TaxID=2528239 RepID=UPI0028AF1DFB|nr:hypothetical protein [Agrobacterium cavarae]